MSSTRPADGGAPGKTSRSDERNRAFIQTSSEAIWCFELDEPVPIELPAAQQVERMFRHAWLAECNDALARMYGFTRAEEIVGARLDAFLLADDPANVTYLMRFVESGYRLEDQESHERDRHGEPRWFLNNLVGVVEDGALTRAWGTQRDVSDAKRNQAAIEAALVRSAELEHRLTLLTVASRRLLATLDAEGLHGAILELGRELVQADAVAVWRSGAGLWRAVAHTGLSDSYVSAALQPVSGHPALAGDAILYEDVLASPDLASRHAAYREEGIVSMLLAALRVGDEDTGTLVFYSRRPGRFTEVDRRTAGALANVAALALENARLYREAEEANRLKDQFLATLSHELRTPLNALLGWSRMLADGVLDAAAATRALQAIQRNAQVQAQLVGDILELSRIMSGKIDLSFEKVELSSLVLDTLESLQPSLADKRLSIETSFAGSLVVIADRGRLQQVVLNLLTNAVKFTPESGRITIAGRQHDNGVEVGFRDTGIGIAAEFLPHVFERFRQAEPSTSRAHGGLGIGLSVCRHLVELHGGTISAESDGPGRGAVFIVRLPVERTT